MPMAALIPKSVYICANPMTTYTIAIRPKSSGRSRRASTIIRAVSFAAATMLDSVVHLTAVTAWDLSVIGTGMCSGVQICMSVVHCGSCSTNLFDFASRYANVDATGVRVRGN